MTPNILSKQISLHIQTIILFSLLLLLLQPSLSFGYTPPIGVPDPGMWGNTHPIDSTAPDEALVCPNWPQSESTDCYYIDNTNSNATDTSNDFGYPAKPRLTVPSKTFTAGSYILIQGGPYSTNITLSPDGTSNKPVWFRGKLNSLPIFTKTINIVNGKYALFEYLDFNGGTGACIRYTGSQTQNISIRNSKFRNRPWISNTAAIAGVPDQGGYAHDIVIYNNLFHNLGDWTVSVDQDFHGINPTLWGRTPPTTHYNVWALNNTGYNISGNLIQFNGDQRYQQNLPYLHHVYAGFNYGHHNRQDICVMKLTTDGIISQNISHDNHNNAAGGGTGVVFQEGPNYVWIIFNKLYNLIGEGVRQSNTDIAFAGQKVFIIGNLIYNITKVQNDPDKVNSRYKSGQGLTFEKGYMNRYVVDNTIFNVAGGISTVGATSTDIVKISGNVIANVNGYDMDGQPDFHISRVTDLIDISIDRVFFQPRSDDGTVRFFWQTSTITKFTDLYTFQSSTGQCTNCWEGDPGFVDSVRYDLHPRDGSPLIGKGVRNPVYDEFKARYGIDIAYDFDRKPRPTGTDPWTLGAFEYNSTPPVGETGTVSPTPVIKSIIQK